MERTLDVYLHNELVGHLIQENGGQMLFGYTESWLQKPAAMPFVALIAAEKRIASFRSAFLSANQRHFFLGQLLMAIC
jgi:HipA-like protein